MRETPLDMERRHVTEGAERIARQEALVAKLERDGHTHLLPDAHALLAEFRDIQQLSEDHVDRLLSEANRD